MGGNLALNSGFGIRTGGGGGNTPSSSTPKYEYVVPAGGVNSITVPPTMVCGANTIVFLDSDLLNTGYSRTGNVFTFTFTIQENVIVTFKN